MIYPIVHAEREFRYHEKLKSLLAVYPEFQFIDHCCYTDTVLPLLQLHQPQVLITASKLFDDANAVASFCNYRDANMPHLKIIVLTSKENIDHFLNSVALGVNGYISKSCSVEEIYHCLTSVINGDNYLGVQKDVIKHK